MKTNITQMTLRRILPLMLGLMVCILIVIAFNLRSLVLASMEERVLSIAEVTKAGLTAHMKAGQMDKRAYFIDEIASMPYIESLTIIRSDAIYAQFGDPNNPSEKRADDSIRSILEAKKPYFTISEWGEKATMRAIVPYVATSDDNLNCLTCHRVPENTVLGAVDIQIDVTQYRNKAWIYLVILLIIISFFTLLIAFNTSTIIERYVRRPMLDLIHYAKSVFYRSDTTPPESFNTREFDDVARQFLHFGEELRNREQRIEQAAISFHSLNDEIDSTLKQTLFAMGEAEEKRSNETRNHTRRVVEYSRLIGTLANLTEAEIEILASAAPLHDIGKIAIPDSILLKPGKLSDEESAIMRMHSAMGHDILKHSERDVLLAAATIAHQHHERWDGGGYPRGLNGKEIHIFGRIVAIADVMDALATKRVYKEPWPLESIKDFFLAERGKAFDPDLINLVVVNFEHFEEIFDKYH